MEIKEVKGVVKNYAWGNRDFIPSLLGGYDGEPQAEYWMGTHPSGEAVIVGGEKLSEYLASDDGILGDVNVAKWGRRLPLLFKILAIASPLSLQCHPDRAQAQEGWKREEQLRKEGKPYNYQDDNPKAEILVALTPVSAMCGFRENEEIQKNLSKILPTTYDKYLSEYADDNQKLFMRLYVLSENERLEVLSEYAEGLKASSDPAMDGEYLTEKGIGVRALEIYPGDIGALFPFILNVMHLKPGEGIFLKPDTLHAYVLGNGVELMDASDNVLRGGLTKKRIDLDELKRIMVFDSEEAHVASVHEDVWGRTVYETPTDGFTLLSADSGLYSIRENRVMLGIVTEGKVDFNVDDESVSFEKGQCFIIPHKISEYYMRIFGNVFFAAVTEDM